MYLHVPSATQLLGVASAVAENAPNSRILLLVIHKSVEHMQAACPKLCQIRCLHNVLMSGTWLSQQYRTRQPAAARLAISVLHAKHGACMQMMNHLFEYISMHTQCHSPIQGSTLPERDARYSPPFRHQLHDVVECVAEGESATCTTNLWAQIFPPFSVART
jgi:hypothetical protein